MGSTMMLHSELPSKKHLLSPLLGMLHKYSYQFSALFGFYLNRTQYLAQDLAFQDYHLGSWSDT